MPLAPYTAYTDTFFLPPSLQETTNAVHITLKFSRAERKVLRKRKDILTSEHAEKHRFLSSKDSDREGPWKNSITPYLVGPMDAAFFPSVRQMVLCKPPQTGGSEAINNIVSKIVDREPGNTLYVYPNEKDAKKNIKRRVLTMIKSSPRLASYLTGYKDDESSALINLSHMMIRAGWAGSPQSLASTPERYVIFEEPDKYTENKKEASSIDLGRKRARTYRGREKIFYVSSPSTENGPIWQELLDSEVIFEFVVICPHCLGHQVMDMGNRESKGGLKWPEDERDHNTIESKELAWYQCWHCQAKWDDYTRDKAVTHGYWRQKTKDGNGLEMWDYLKKNRPKKIGFQYSALISTFVSLSEYAAAFLKGTKNKNALKDFLNGYAAEPWTNYTQERDEDRILTLCDNRPPGLIPGNGQVSALFAGVDTHGPGVGAGFWFIIRAYGWTKRWTEDGQLIDIPQEKWLIRKGFVKTFTDLEQVLIQDKYHDQAGNVYPIHRVVQDAMGLRTKEVYDFSRKYRGWLHPFQGKQSMTKLWRFSPQDHYPGTNKPIPGGVQLLQGNVTLYKSALSTDLSVASGDPGCRWLHASVETLTTAGYPNPSSGIDFDFARQLTAEYVDDKGFWQCPDSRANEFWDCEVYADIAADVAQCAMWTPPKPGPEEFSEYQTVKSSYLNG